MPEANPDAPPPGATVPAEEPSRAAVERLTGRPVGELSLYRQALTHRSLLRGAPGSHLQSNERLEFLGDAVLGMAVAEVLYRHFPDEDEGYLTRLRAKLVSGAALARYARRIGLGRSVRMSDNMAQAGGRDSRTILADAFEALIGALYLDQGLEATRAFVRRVILEEVNLDALARRQDNYKSLLLEHVQALGQAQPQYRTLHEEGPSHDKVFTVEVRVGKEAFGTGTARSKKRAEQQAAQEALRRLQEGAGEELA